MKTITNIIDELNLENGSNHKIKVLKANMDNKLLEKVLKMTYDKVTYSYGIGKVSLAKLSITNHNNKIELETALDLITYKITTREITGNSALEYLGLLLQDLSEEDSKILIKVIERDLRINLGRTQINKVFKNLIVKPNYMRCDIYGDKTKKNIKFPALVQIKEDGTYREFHVQDGEVYCNSRSGESYEYPIIFEQMKDYPNGHYTGELLVKNISNRSEGNGLINSSFPPHDDIIFKTWDYITEEEYKKANLKDKKDLCTTIYIDRFETLSKIIVESENIKLIDSIVVNTLEEAVNKTSIWMKEGLEGSILKDKSGVFKDGTSKHQLKLKIAFNLEVRIVGFIEGTPGTKRVETFGSLIYETDDGQIKGSVSGISDDLLTEINNNRSKYINTIIEIEGNDLTKGRNNDYYAVSHPRFVEFRNDRDTTDDIKRALASLESAKMFKNR